MKAKMLPQSIAGLLLATALAYPADAAVKDACTVLTSADAQAVLGEPVGPPEPQTRSTGAGESSVCRFRSAQGKALSRKTLSVTIQYSREDLSGTAAEISSNLKSAGFKTVRDVPGVGDHAVWGITSLMGRAMDELTVLKGKRVMLIILTVGVQDEAAALDRSKSLAAKILPKT